MPVSIKKGILPPMVAIILFAFITTISFLSSLDITQFFKEFQKADAATISPYVEADGKGLRLYGESYQFTGVNAFNLATLPGANAGCGGYVEDLDGFFSKLRPNSMVRMWAFQGTMATNPDTKKIDWSGLDRVVNAAQRNNIKLIFVLTEQAGACDDGHWKDLAWYQGGYKQAFNDYGNGLTPIPYVDYVKQIVTRYKDSPAVAVWEPVNEGAPANCANGKKGDDCWAYQVCTSETAAAETMRTFFDVVGGTIKSIDPNHLVSSGVIGSGQCGAVYGNYKYIHDTAGIDVGSYHDYSHINEPMPGDQWNGLEFRIRQMHALNKPIIIGETGMMASATGNGCITYTSRKDKMKAKMDAQFGAGVAGFIPWSYTGASSSSCNYDIVANDPLLTLLHDYPVSMGGTAPAPSSTPFPTATPKPPDTDAPTVPSGLVATNVAIDKVTLTWQPSTDNEGVSRYEVYRDYQYLTATSNTTLTNTTVKPGTRYVYYLKARDAAGNSSGSSAKLVVTTPTSSGSPTPIPTPTSTPSLTPAPGPDTEPPSAPTNLRTRVLAPNQVTITWDAATDNVGVVRYDIFRDYWYVTSTTGTSLTNTTVKPNTRYMYYVKARDAAGFSSVASNKLVLTTPLQ